MGQCLSCCKAKDPQYDTQTIFVKNVVLPVNQYAPPNRGGRFTTTLQLAYCLRLIHSSLISDEGLNEIEQKQQKDVSSDEDEKARIKAIPSDLIRAFIQDDLKRQNTVAEIVSLAAVLEKDDFKKLLQVFVDGINDSELLQVHLLDGLSQLIRNVSQEYIDSDDLVTILRLLHRRLMSTHKQSTEHTYRLALTLSNVLDSMVGSQVKGISSEQLSTPLNDCLNELQRSPDAYLVYQAAYTSQALIYINDDCLVLKTAVQRTGKLFQGALGMAWAVKSLNVAGIIEGLNNIQSGLTGARDTARLAKNTYKNAKSLIESGQGLLETLKDCFKQKSAWYPALRVLDRSILECRFADFEELVRKTPCRKELAFQWGLCQRLGEIAASNVWDIEIRKCAIDFLGELYRDDATWGPHAVVKQCVFCILSQLAKPGEHSTSSHANALLEKLGTNGDTKKKKLYQRCKINAAALYPLIFYLQPTESQLLDLIQNKPDVETPLRSLKNRRLKDPVVDVYIRPKGKSGPIATDDFDLMIRVQDFLKSNRKVFLLRGDPGAGKSTFSRTLETYLWNKFSNEESRVPLFIHLPLIENPDYNLITKQLQRLDFTENQIKELKEHHKFILICDGYDEIQQTKNLYDANQFNKPGEWQVQMVISCSTEYIGADYKNQFQPMEMNSEYNEQFEEAVIASFSKSQIQEYIERYVSLKTQQDVPSDDKDWRPEEYEQTLENIPDLYDLVANPFLLTLALKALPGLLDSSCKSSEELVTRIRLYDKFVSQWIERAEKRLRGMELSPCDKVSLRELSQSSFMDCCISYLKEFATEIYDYQGGKPVVSYLKYRNQEDWKKELFNNDKGRNLLREAIPLTRNAGQYQFIHKSVLEYGLSLVVWDPNEDYESMEPSSTTSRLLKSPLERISFIHHPSILEFLAERVRQQQFFEEQLHYIIKQPRTDENAGYAAVNAIAILDRAGIQFNGTNLQDIKTPGSNSSHGVFANSKGAQMTGAQLGELSCLQQCSEVRSCLFSPHDKIFAVGLSTSDINLYDTSGWKEILSLKGHGDCVNDLAFSSKSRQIASGSDDETVRLWEVDTGVCSQIMQGHSDLVKSVTYSPEGDQVASGSDDKTVRLWDVKNGNCIKTLEGHSGKVRCVVYSPKGNQIASGSDDNTARLWDVETGNCIKTLQGHRGRVRSIVYSPKGDRIASGSWDWTVRLWNVNTGECIQILQGHMDNVTSVAYSPKGDQIASGSWDQTVQLWDVGVGNCTHILQGHCGWVKSVAYSPGGDRVASGSWDRTVRLWDVNAGNCT
ncbi:hypothetical protein BGZ80_002018 [Entomortierella chlamydospora]|uniref:NACHT domain-containing protein n=1 Tax=Entomortierella chlamydospora TaxID=101097 RepID=A0A9P6MQS2_9FUNG|nr:hypothetical protein BGZ80_002018 [Entomortierella chlamydospora]